MSVLPELKIISDHLRSSCFLIADGILPSNEGRGYVLRRIMRRGMRQIHKLGAKEASMYKMVDALIKEMGDAYPELNRARSVIIETLKSEEEKFRETLEKGLKILEEEITQNQKSAQGVQHKILSGALAFKLYDTYGFPLDLTQDIAKEKNIEVDVVEFNREMELQRERARKNWVGSGEVSEDSFFFELKEKFGETEFVGYNSSRCNVEILAIIENGKTINEISKTPEKNTFVILNQTPFYATSGGQKGDDGNLFLTSELDSQQIVDYSKINNFIEISETRKIAGGLFAHFICEVKGTFKVGDKSVAIINSRNRQLRAQNHSATHLLHKALKKILGDSISQKGSNVDFKQLTFDFNLNRAMTKEEIDDVEDLVNFYIRQNSPVKTNLMELEKARQSGAEALFGEKYDAEVRVVKMGESVELCGGTHVEQTGNIGIFKIISENGVAAGIRRITAKSGFYAFLHTRLQEKKLQNLVDSLKIKLQSDEIKNDAKEFLSSKVGFNEIVNFNQEISNKITSESENESLQQILKQTAKIGEDFQQELRKKDKEIERLKKQIALSELNNLKAEKIGEVNFLHHVFVDADAKEIREIISSVGSQNNFSNSHVIAFFGVKDNKVALCIAVSSDLQSKFDATKLIIPAIEKIDGKGGGGKKDFAMGGGNNKDGIPQAINQIISLLN